nr:hypothetical protein [Variovorax soli]
MTDIASVLKSEIARIARKEVRAEIESLKEGKRSVPERYRRVAAPSVRVAEATEADGSPNKGGV